VNIIIEFALVSFLAERSLEEKHDKNNNKDKNLIHKVRDLVLAYKSIFFFVTVSFSLNFYMEADCRMSISLKNRTFAFDT
jgi:Na+/H+ antiporter NhaD/arsenite permease-like protein